MAENAIFRACEVRDTKKEDVVRIGLLETTYFCADYVSFKLENDRADVPMDRIIWERRDMHSLAGALMNDEFDLVITWSGELPYFNEEEIAWGKIFSSPDAVFIPRNHPLFEKGIKSLADCRPYSFITLSPIGYPHYYSYLETLCRTFGFEPIISTVCGSTDSARYNLSLGRGLYVAPSLICSDWESEDVKKAEFEGGSSSDLIIVWKKAKMNPLMEKIVYLVTH